jgi:3-oxoacyl-[acyl-carrier protein] reductase
MGAGSDPLAEVPVPTYPDLAGKVAVVTGGSRGIGAATCRLLAGQGSRVVVNGRDPAAIEKLVAEITGCGGRAIGAVADCRDFAAIERMRERTERELGPADILVAYAGGFGSYTPAHLIEEEEWRAVIDSNLTATFLTVKSFLPGMIERRTGSIVTMASNAARVLDILTTASYAASKAGIVMFSRHVAKEVGEHGVRVNCVAPATVLSERVHRIMSEERQREVAALAPLGRLGSPEDVGLATLFLASDSSSWLTGVTLDIAGGRIMM